MVRASRSGWEMIRLPPHRAHLTICGWLLKTVPPPRIRRRLNACLGRLPWHTTPSRVVRWGMIDHRVASMHVDYGPDVGQTPFNTRNDCARVDFWNVPILSGGTIRNG